MPFLLMAKKNMGIIPLSFPKRSASINKLRNESNEYFLRMKSDSYTALLHAYFLIFRIKLIENTFFPNSFKIIICRLIT